MDNQKLRRNVARLLRAHRGEHNMSFADYGRESGVSPKTIEKLSQSKGNPTIKTLEKIARYMGIEMQDLMFNEDLPISKLSKGRFP